MITNSTTIYYHPTSYSARYTFSGKERDEETGYSYFGARYYNSSYSIWMSVDPMANKYPSLSPYVYCGNNPVKLVDPDGEEWEKKEDEEYANKLITTARKRQEGLDPESIKYKIIQEGIDGLCAMGMEKGQKYGFKKSNTADGHITKEDGIIYMNYSEIEGHPEQKDASAWHETVHLSRYNSWKQNGEPNSKTHFAWGVNTQGTSILYFSNDFFEETYTTYSTMLFSPQSVHFYNGTYATNLQSVKEYMGRKQLYRNRSYDGFRLSDGVNGVWLR